VQGCDLVGCGVLADAALLPESTELHFSQYVVFSGAGKASFGSVCKTGIRHWIVEVVTHTVVLYKNYLEHR
jgi:hypothetical protein